MRDRKTIIVGVYLGTDYAGRWLFDLRPTHGTTTIDPEGVELQQMDDA
jgi:hypothetical protein